MLRQSYRLFVVVLCAVVCAAAAAVWQQPGAGYVVTEDHNGDGRPDVWRVYDRHRQLSEVSVDTNFDGRSDVHEYYERGALVRRESDRDFNDRVDLIEEFDSATRDRVRSVVDVDYDGTADLLVLFQRGQPVFTKWTHLATPRAATSGSTRRVEPSQRTANDRLTPLDDPFRADLTIRSVHLGAPGGDYIGLATSGGLPASSVAFVCPFAPSSKASISGVSHVSSAPAVPYSPRGPPATLLA